jgi:aarF domain-containing kinase
LDAAFINAALSVEIIEGVASSLHPEIMVVSTAMPLVMKAELMHRLPLSWSQASQYLSSSSS